MNRRNSQQRSKKGCLYLNGIKADIRSASTDLVIPISLEQGNFVYMLETAASSTGMAQSDVLDMLARVQSRSL
jgi:hypothetical protein